MILLSHTAIRLRSVFVFHTQIIIRFIYPKTCRSVVFSILVGFFALFRRNWQTFSPENNTYTKNDFFRVDGHYDLELLVKINCKVKVIDWFWLFHLLFGVRFFLPLQSTKKTKTNTIFISSIFVSFNQKSVSRMHAKMLRILRNPNWKCWTFSVLLFLLVFYRLFARSPTFNQKYILSDIILK